MRFYEKERKAFIDEQCIKLTDHEAELIARKIARHFHFRLDYVRFYGARQTGLATFGWHGARVRLSHTPSVELVAHELAHLWQFEKFHRVRHDTQLWRLIVQILDYCRKMNYWRVK